LLHTRLAFDYLYDRVFVSVRLAFDYLYDRVFISVRLAVDYLYDCVLFRYVLQFYKNEDISIN